ncbi:hypothetical protein O3P69_015931 [Scylla paramamosain]|uniref:Pro-resilin n=1 Tax=Scylla paramamosain TaxID=85552 RepID=A0AAW0T8A2_SCYPA
MSQSATHELELTCLVPIENGHKKTAAWIPLRLPRRPLKGCEVLFLVVVVAAAAQASRRPYGVLLLLVVVVAAAADKPSPSYSVPVPVLLLLVVVAAAAADKPRPSYSVPVPVLLLLAVVAAAFADKPSPSYNVPAPVSVESFRALRVPQSYSGSSESSESLRFLQGPSDTSVSLRVPQGPSDPSVSLRSYNVPQTHQDSSERSEPSLSLRIPQGPSESLRVPQGRTLHHRQVLTSQHASPAAPTRGGKQQEPRGTRDSRAGSLPTPRALTPAPTRTRSRRRSMSSSGVWTTASLANNYGHQEARDDEHTQGGYYADLPDGRKQNVKYVVDGDSGFLAEVTYEGEARYSSEESREYSPPRPTYA